MNGMVLYSIYDWHCASRHCPNFFIFKFNYFKLNFFIFLIEKYCSLKKKENKIIRAYCLLVLNVF